MFLRFLLNKTLNSHEIKSFTKKTLRIKINPVEFIQIPITFMDYKYQCKCGWWTSCLCCLLQPWWTMCQNIDRVRKFSTIVANMKGISFPTWWIIRIDTSIFLWDSFNLCVWTWWGYTNMMFRSSGWDHIFFVGLTRTSFYCYIIFIQKEIGKYLTNIKFGASSSILCKNDISMPFNTLFIPFK